MDDAGVDGLPVIHFERVELDRLKGPSGVAVGVVVLGDGLAARPDASVAGGPFPERAAPLGAGMMETDARLRVLEEGPALRRNRANEGDWFDSPKPK